MQHQHRGAGAGARDVELAPGNIFDPLRFQATLMRGFLSDVFSAARILTSSPACPILDDRRAWGLEDCVRGRRPAICWRTWRNFATVDPVEPRLPGFDRGFPTLALRYRGMGR